MGKEFLADWRHKMAETVSNYKEIVAHFTEETIADRYRFLHDKMQEYIKERKQEEFLKVD